VDRDELGALVWRQSTALTCPVPKTRQLAMEVILQAADDYASTRAASPPSAAQHSPPQPPGSRSHDVA